MEVVHNITLFLHLLNCSFLLFSLFPAYLASCGSTLKDLFASLSGISRVITALLGERLRGQWYR